MRQIGKLFSGGYPEKAFDADRLTFFGVVKLLVATAAAAPSLAGRDCQNKRLTHAIATRPSDRTGGGS